MSRLNEKTLKKIRDVFQQCGSIRETARLVGVSRNAVKRALKRTAKPDRTVPQSTARSSKLDPFKAKIRFLVEEKKLSGVRSLEEIKELGYQGGYSILKDFIRSIRPRKTKGLTIPIQHQPGHEGQMDWSVHRVILGGRTQAVHTGSFVLCYSRWLYFFFFSDEVLESVIALHIQAFIELNAVPATITYDNMTTVGRHIDGEIWINPQFKAFADEYGFEIIILPPGAKDRHGVVERPFHYIENNFLAGREFEDLEDLNRRADAWRRDVANVRIHGTLREKPLERLKREFPFLNPLPHIQKERYYRKVNRLVSREFCIAIDTNHYSVSPQLFCKEVEVRLYEAHLEVWREGKLDCKHTYCRDRYQRQVLPEHEKIYRELTHQKSLLEIAFLRIGSAARTYYDGLKKEKGGAAGYHLQRILKMVERYGADVVCGAIANAQKYGAYSADSVLRIINGQRLKGKNGHLPTHESIPENIKQWLRACAVEKDEPAAFDRIMATQEKTIWIGTEEDKTNHE